MTPMMLQYLEIKEQYKDYVLFYRLGDFYEMFFDDAIRVSKELELTLTGRDCGEENRAPMCGVPFHSADGYIGKLIEKGYKVAICEQTEDHAQAKGLVRREVIRIITPGTVIDASMLNESTNNYLCSVYDEEECAGVAFADVSTGQIYATAFRGEGRKEALHTEIKIYSPKEIISGVNSDDLSLGELGIPVNDSRRIGYTFLEAKLIVSKQFKDLAPDSQEPQLVCAVGGLLSYIADTQMTDISYIKELSVYNNSSFLELDINTRRNLELTATMRTKEKRGSLLWVLDKTKTAMGARLLKNWIEHPLVNVSDIEQRQSATAELYGDFMLREDASALLSGVLDLERLITKVVYGTANAKDLLAIGNTIKIIPELRKLFMNSTSAELSEIYNNLDELNDLCELIKVSINESAPFSVREGNIIADGYDKDVDYLRSVMKDGEGWIKEIERNERELTGIKTLKVGYNRVFGYYIEVTKSLIDQVPDRYIRKQTLSGCERYITQELKDMEATILGAADKIATLEYEIFQKIRGFIAENSARIQDSAARIAKLDVYISLASVAAKNKYVCPEIDCSDIIQIKDGRHPVVEQFVKGTYFVPNDVFLDTSRNNLMLITGPNMAGKSTYMRQIALICVMAQIGSFVPASDARIGVVDKIFTRVGASDDLASGQSTFMLEMNEVAHILKNATKKSLIIYDEVGRGTSTYDGMSIARAIVEYTYKKIGAKTLFATHYHELTSLEDEFEGIINYNIAAKKRDDNITFLRKIVRGATDDSYGIEVAKLAGVPNEVIKRAKDILHSIEDSGTRLELSKSKNTEKANTEDTISIFDVADNEVIDELKKVDINTLSPYEAMSFLFELKKKLN